MYEKLTERQLEQLFLGKKVRKNINPLKWALIFACTFVVVLVLINLPAFSSSFDYWFSVQLQNKSYENPVVEKVVNNQKPASALLPVVTRNTIYIDKLDLHAPITFDVPNETKAVADNLQNGTIHIAGTAHPGEVGNVFITGHSSNFAWAKGSYSHVFALLGKLEVNDNITVNYNDTIYIYRIEDKFVASADDIGNLKQAQKSELTLMTCYPVGTNLNRLMVKAIQVKPNPSTNQKKSPSTLDNLPDIKR